MSQVQPAPVDERLGYVLKKAAAALRSAMDGALRPLELTVPQYACLQVLAEQPGLSGAELARAVFVSRQSMNLVLRGLEQRGLLARASSPQRGKSLPVALTQRGAEQLAAANRALVVVEATLSSALDAEDEQRLCAGLGACAAALQQLGDEPDGA